MSVCEFVVEVRKKGRKICRSQVRKVAYIYICVSNFWERGYNEMKDGAEGGVRKLEGLYDKADCRARRSAQEANQLIEKYAA